MNAVLRFIKNLGGGLVSQEIKLVDLDQIEFEAAIWVHQEAQKWVQAIQKELTSSQKNQVQQLLGLVEKAITEEKTRRENYYGETPELTSLRQIKALVIKSKFINSSDNGMSRDRCVILSVADKTYSNLLDGDYPTKFKKNVQVIRIWFYNLQPNILPKKYQKLQGLIGDKERVRLTIHLTGAAKDYHYKREKGVGILDIPCAALGKIELYDG